ncbi:hypothetical protein CF327_g3459 [Tilletia walkeri]|nr:hypothetical protein CF327_g3459 [Tilletia walkeri]
MPKTRSQTAPGRAPAPAEVPPAPSGAGPASNTPSAPSTTAAALKALRTDLDNAAAARNKETKAKNAAWNKLFSYVQEMAQAQGSNVETMTLLMATCRASIKHTEAGLYAPAFPPELVEGLNSYIVRAPKASFKSLGQHSTPATTGSAPVLNPSVAPAPHSNTRTLKDVSAQDTRNFLPDSLNDWCVVGMGRGSASAAVKSGGIKDHRLIARFDRDHETLKLDPSAQRDLANQALSAGYAPLHAHIRVVDRVATGLALTPSANCTLEELEPDLARIAASLGARVVERNQNWNRWVIRCVDTKFDDNDLRGEIIAGLRIADPDRPHLLVGNVRRLCATGAAQHLKHTCVTFSTLPGTSLRAGSHFDLFGRRAWLEVYRPLKKLDHCERCLAYSHPSDKCTSEQPRCAQCAAWGHSSDSHTCDNCKEGPRSCLPRCAHCRGPHEAGHGQCPGRAKFDKKARAYVYPKGDTLNAIMRSGDKVRLQTMRAAQESDRAAASSSNVDPAAK